MCNMTRQHFQFIAETIASLGMETDGLERQTITSVAFQFGLALQATNPNFDRHRFMSACVPVEGSCSDECDDTPFVHLAPAEGDANFERLRLDNKYDGVPADTGTHE